MLEMLRNLSKMIREEVENAFINEYKKTKDIEKSLEAVDILLFDNFNQKIEYDYEVINNIINIELDFNQVNYNYIEYIIFPF